LVCPADRWVSPTLAVRVGGGAGLRHAGGAARGRSPAPGGPAGDVGGQDRPVTMRR